MTDFADTFAFPVSTIDGYMHNGLTKREYFAAMAMQGLCSSPEYRHETYRATAEVAAMQADALIAVMEKTA